MEKLYIYHWLETNDIYRSNDEPTAEQIRAVDDAKLVILLYDPMIETVSKFDPVDESDVTNEDNWEELPLR